MLHQNAVRKFSLYLLLIIFGALAGFYLGTIETPGAQAAEGVEQQEPPANPDEINSQHVCTPSNVAVFDNRIHIKCDTLYDGTIRYFALSTADSRHVARVLSLLLTAKASGQRVGIDFNDNDTSGTAIGCYSSDCRLIRWVWIIN